MSRPSFLSVAAWLGFAFLYAPIIALVIYSFNESKLVAVWGGFSTKWYGALLKDEAILKAAELSIRIALASATLATAIGLAAAFALVRFGRFRGRLFLAGAITAPLVMPEVVTGLSLLLLFVAMETMIGWPGARGELTVIIAHATFCSAYVAVVAQSRLADMDRTLEEAALDLGARPWRVFVDVTLPMIAPAVLAGWLLAFTLSLDDLVIASFVNGPGATTLPQLVFSKVRLGVSPDINALASLMIAVAAIGVIAAAVLTRRR